MQTLLRFSFAACFVFLLNYISAQPNPDPNAPVMQFDSLEYHFGTLVQGETITHEFKFKNTGKTPLVIESGYTSTGATVLDYPKEPIAPGKTGLIKFTFNTTGKMGEQDKTGTINSNNRDGQIILHLKGKVVPKPIDPNAPVLRFDSLHYDFGTVKQGELVNYEFHFTNTGKSPLIIETVYTNTGAAVASWPKEPILPGKTGIVKYTLNTVGKSGQQSKTLSIKSNASEPMIVLRVTGKVEAPPATEIAPSKPSSGTPANDN